jgi:hypothetical protein
LVRFARDAPPATGRARVERWDCRRRPQHPAKT